MIVFLFPAFWIWARWYSQLFFVFKQNASSYPRLLLQVIPVIATSLLFCVLRYFGATSIRSDPDLLFFYLFFGLAIIGLLQWFSPYLGLSMRDDILERDNEGASYALSGAILGMTFCFAGANAGEGPGPMDVLFCLALNLPCFIFLWIVLEVFGNLSDRMTIDFDDACGLRLGTFLICAGLILGRAVAGSWVSKTATIFDFIHLAWPLLPLVVAFAVVDALSKPNKTRPIPSFLICGFIPSIMLLIVSTSYVIHLGCWS